MSLHFNESTDACEDPAQMEIAGLMDMRRRALHNQMVADGVKNELCDAVIEWRGKLGIGNNMIRGLRDSDDPVNRSLYNYISKLESFQAVFWCGKCGKMSNVGDKPEGVPTVNSGGGTQASTPAPAPQSSAPQPTPATFSSQPACATPTTPAVGESSVLDQDIPEYLSMDETVIVLRGLQYELREMRSRMQKYEQTKPQWASVPGRDVQSFVDKYGYVEESADLYGADSGVEPGDGGADEYYKQLLTADMLLQ
jgi:hypothetical protein